MEPETIPDNTRMIEALPDGPLYGSYRGKTAGKFIGLNPKGWGPLTLQDCQCGACRVIRERSVGQARVGLRGGKDDALDMAHQPTHS